MIVGPGSRLTEIMHLVQNHCIKLASGNAEAVNEDGECGKVGDGGDEGFHQAERGIPLDGQALQAGEKLRPVFHPSC